MLIALLIVAFLVYLCHKSESSDNEKKIEVTTGTKLLLVSSLIVLVVQVVLGTKVREAIDRIAASVADRSLWIENLGMEFLVHRSFSLVVLIINVILVIKLWKTSYDKALSRILITLILGTLLTGAGMGYFSVLAVLQPIHLLLATVTFGIQLYMIFDLINRSISVNSEIAIADID